LEIKSSCVVFATSARAASCAASVREQLILFQEAGNENNGMASAMDVLEVYATIPAITEQFNTQEQTRREKERCPAGSDNASDATAATTVTLCLLCLPCFC
jgi:hypothetical protein